VAFAAIQSVGYERRHPRGILGRERGGANLRKHRVANRSNSISARVRVLGMQPTPL
jgi:hypothetical protein